MTVGTEAVEKAFVNFAAKVTFCPTRIRIAQQSNRVVSLPPLYALLAIPPGFAATLRLCEHPSCNNGAGFNLLAGLNKRRTGGGGGCPGNHGSKMRAPLPQTPQTRSL